MTNEEILKEFDDYHARCIGSDAEYTDAEMAKIISDRLKSNYEWDRAFLLSHLTLARQQLEAEHQKCCEDWVKQVEESERKALVAHNQGREEMRREVVNIDFYAWNDDTQRMIKEKIKSALEKTK